MPNLAAAVRAAVLAAHPEATVDSRTEQGIRHRIADADDGRARYVLDSGIGPIHYQDSAQGTDWQEINTDWGASTLSGFTDAVTSARFHVHSDANGRRRVYPRRAVQTEFVEFAQPQYWTGTAWANLPMGTRAVTGDTILWDRPAFSIKVQHGGSLLKVEVVLKTSAAAKRIRWPVSLTGLTWNNWTLVSNSDSTVVAEIPTPTMVDAAGTERALTFGYNSGAVEISADATGLVYPLTVDPTINVQVGAGANDVGVSAITTMGTGGTFSATENRIGKTSTGASTLAAISTLIGGISITAGATITVAYLTYTAANTQSGTVVRTTLWADNAATPSAPTDTTTFWGITKTTHSVAWDSISAWTSNLEYQTPSLVNLVQELVTDNGAYSSGSMQFVHWNNASDNSAYRRRVDYTTSSTTATKLHIEYTAGGGGTDHPFSAAGTLATSGTLGKGIGKGLAGVLASAGALGKGLGKAFAGTLTSSGTISRVLGFSRAFAGTLVTGGTLAKGVGKSLSGSLVSSGTLAKGVGKPLAGTLTSTGNLAKGIAKPFAGTLASTGSLVKGVGKSFAGTLTSSGTLTRTLGIARSFAGTLSATGSLAKGRATNFAGTLATSGVVTRTLGLSRSFAGTLVTVGTLAKGRATSFAGTLVTTGEGVFTRGARAIVMAFAGTLVLAGDVQKGIGKRLAGTLDTSGSLARTLALARQFAGTLVTTGALTRQLSLFRQFDGTLVTSGAMTIIGRLVAGILTLGETLLGVLGLSEAKTSTLTATDAVTASLTVSDEIPEE